MKQIIVGIDFSVYSFRAMEYAAVLASKTGAGITMVWVNKSGIQDTADAETRLEEMLRTFSGKSGIGKIGYLMASGKVYLEISRIAEEKKADFIVIGVHGESGFDPFWMGSTSHRIISHAACPVISIGKDVDFNRPATRILLPIDNSENTRQKLPIAIDLAGIFSAKIVLLGVFTSKLENVTSEAKAYINEVKTFLAGHKIPYEYFEIQHHKYAAAVLDHAKCEKADIIVTTSVQEAEETVLIGKNDYKIIHKAEVPVVSVHPKLINPLAYSNVIGNYD